MKKYEAVIILNPNLSSKVDTFKEDFEKLLSSNSFNVVKYEDVGRRQLAYSINNHNKGHYLLFNIEGDPAKLIEIENKIKYDESIIRHLFIIVKEHSGEDSQLLIDSKNRKTEAEEIENKKVEKEPEVIKPTDKVETKEVNSQEEAEEQEQVKVSAEVVNGKCPTCDEFTMLVGLTPEMFRCMNCGSDLRQHINGKITYLPIMSSPTDGAVPFVKEWTTE